MSKIGVANIQPWFVVTISLKSVLSTVHSVISLRNVMNIDCVEIMAHVSKMNMAPINVYVRNFTPALYVNTVKNVSISHVHRRMTIVIHFEMRIISVYPSKMKKIYE